VGHELEERCRAGSAPEADPGGRSEVLVTGEVEADLVIELGDELGAVGGLDAGEVALRGHDSNSFAFAEPVRGTSS
jgi:hypothetical protein